MATIHKCDKCGKKIKKGKVDISIGDWERVVTEKFATRFEFCATCAKPVAIYLNKYIS